MSNKKIPVAVLAATGAVGQRFVQLIEGHPWFDVVALTGSPRTIGKKYGETGSWLLPTEIPESVRDLEVLPSTPEAVKTPLALLDFLGFKIGVTVTRDGDLHLTVFAGQAFGAVAVAGIARLLAFRITLLTN